MKIKALFVIILATILFTACKKNDENDKEIRLIVNHYQQTATGMGSRLVYLTQSGSTIGSTNWANEYNEIIGFNYEPGYVYDLAITVKTIANPPADGSSAEHKNQPIADAETG